MKVKIEKTVLNAEVIISNLAVLTNRTIPDIIKYIALKQSFKNAIYLTWSAKYKYFICFCLAFSMLFLTVSPEIKKDILLLWECHFIFVVK